MQALHVETLGGYRLLRKLGAGKRADIWLGHDGGGVAALKVFRPGVERSSIDIEIEALGRASSRHLLHLNDLATAQEGVPCLILQRLSPAGLGRILAHRVVAPGEAVTILAPLALAIGELHRVGVAHGGISARSVLFDGQGAPVLGCFGLATLAGDFPDPPDAASLTVAQLSADARVLSDLRQLAELTRRVLLGVEGSEAAVDWLQKSEPSDDSQQWPLQLADLLFRIAEPTAVMSSTSDFVQQQYSRIPNSRPDVGVDVNGSVGVGVDVDVDVDEVGPEPRWSDVLALPGSVVRALAGWREWSAREIWGALTAWSARGRVGLNRVGLNRVGLGRVRRRVWVFAAVVSAVVIAGAFALSFVAAGDRSAESLDTQSALPVDVSPSTSGSSAEGVVAGADVADPVIAGQRLLEMRAECLDQLSVLCLERVDQTGSAAMDADTNEIRLVQQGAVDTSGSNRNGSSETGSGGIESATRGADYSAGTVELVERFGGTALLSVTVVVGGQNTPPASLLLVRGETGWLIRDLVAADSGVSGAGVSGAGVSGSEVS